MARLKMIPPAMAAHLHRAVRQAIQVMGADQRVRLQIVALTVERALIEEPGRAVIARACCAPKTASAAG
jgi:hypothetical protein